MVTVNSKYNLLTIYLPLLASERSSIETVQEVGPKNQTTKSSHF